MKRLFEAIPECDPSLKERLSRAEKSIEAFSRFTSVPVTLFSSENEILWEYNKTAKFCITNEAYINPCSTCRKTLSQSMQRSSENGTVETFICTTGLLNICYSLRHKGRVVGYFIAGPVAMGRDKAKTIADFYEKVSNEVIDSNFPQGIVG